MEFDVWFSRVEGDLYFAVALADNPPEDKPRRVRDVHTALSKMKRLDRKVATVGILPPEMIGLEIEV